jgi:hypothetical protein
MNWRWFGGVSCNRPGDEDKLVGDVALEVAKVADARGVGQHRRLRAHPTAGREGHVLEDDGFSAKNIVIFIASPQDLRH